MPTDEDTISGFWKGFNHSPIIHQGSVYLGNRGTYFYKINAKTGKEVWRTKHAFSWIGSAAVISEGSVYYGLSDGLALIGQDIKSGNFNTLIPVEHLIFAQPASGDKQVFFATLAGQLYSYNTSTKLTKLLFQTDESKSNYNEHVNEKGKPIYKGYTPNTPTSENWKKFSNILFQELDSILSVTYEQGVVYIGSAKGRVYAIEL